MRLIARLALMIVLVLVAARSSLLVAQAQGATCYSLAAADCKILSAAEDNVKNMKSLLHTFELTGNLTTSDATGNLNITGGGQYENDESLLDTSDPNSILNALKLTLDLNSTLATTGSLGTSNQKAKFSLVISDGLVYVNSDLNTDGWVGYSINDLIRQAQANTRPSTGNPTLSMFQSPEIMQAIKVIPDIKGFIKLAKTNNSPFLDSQRQIEFVYTFDLLTLLKARQMRPLARALLSAVAGSQGAAVQYTDIEVSNITIGLAKELAGTTLTVTRWVGATDNMFHAFMIDSTFKFKPAQNNGTGQNPGPINAKVHFALKFTKVNKPVNVEAPSDATLLITPSPTPTRTPTNTFTPTATNTPTNTPTPTYTPSPTNTPTNTPTSTNTPTATNTPLPTSTNTPTPLPTNTPTATTAPTNTSMPTKAATVAATAPATQSATQAATQAATQSATQAATQAATATP